MAQFEVGKTYEAADCGIDPIEVVRRTAKSIFVTNGHADWRMIIRHDEDGNEFVIDSSVPMKWRGLMTYSAKWVAE